MVVPRVAVSSTDWLGLARKKTLALRNEALAGLLVAHDRILFQLRILCLELGDVLFVFRLKRFDLLFALGVYSGEFPFKFKGSLLKLKNLALRARRQFWLHVMGFLRLVSIWIGNTRQSWA